MSFPIDSGMLRKALSLFCAIDFLVTNFAADKAYPFYFTGAATAQGLQMWAILGCAELFLSGFLCALKDQSDANTGKIMMCTFWSGSLALAYRGFVVNKGSFGPAMLGWTALTVVAGGIEYVNSRETPKRRSTRKTSSKKN
jgi:hypothetical protein